MTTRISHVLLQYIWTVNVLLHLRRDQTENEQKTLGLHKGDNQKSHDVEGHTMLLLFHVFVKFFWIGFPSYSNYFPCSSGSRVAHEE